MFHKHILYGKQSEWKDTIIIVEGITDVWRFGSAACACFGIKYTSQQLRFIAKNFTKVAVCFDGGELQAATQANRLIAELQFRGVEAFRVDITGDPGSMKQSEADYLVKQLL
jgi:DNA primase